MISSQNVLRHELIGLDVLVSGAANPLHRGLCIPKMHSRFQLHLPGSELVEIDGSVMVLAPEKRINLHEKKRIK